MADRTASPGDWRRSLTRVDVLGVLVTAITIPELHERLRHYIERGRKALVLHANVHCLNIAWEQDWYRAFLNEADVVFCDGAGVRLGALLLGHRIPKRITYADWMWELALFAEHCGYSLFFVGSQPGVADSAAKNLVRRFPQLRILGSHHGYFDTSKDSEENRALVGRINALKPDILVVGLGMPLQEKWLKENWESIAASVALTGGAVFDYVSGNLRRAPKWMTEAGLEWLGRLFIEPKRLWRRYLVGNPKFLWRVLLRRVALSRVTFLR
jgi:N-acetylglucosaminyldiphosphoundecaprenol N-acetyl-beta-D-mannosaminyltransferase